MVIKVNVELTANIWKPSMKKLALSAFVLLAAQESYAGVIHDLIIQNNTNYTINKYSETSVRMNSWNLPETIAAHSQAKTTIEDNRNIDNPDLTQDTGTTSYKVNCPNGAVDNFQIQSRQSDTILRHFYNQKIYVMQYQFHCIQIYPKNGMLDDSSDPLILKVNPF